MGNGILFRYSVTPLLFQSFSGAVGRILNFCDIHMTTTAHRSSLSIYKSRIPPTCFSSVLFLRFIWIQVCIQSKHTQDRRAPGHLTHTGASQKKKGKKSFAFFFFVSYRSCLFDNLIPATLYLVSHTLSSLPVCVCVSLYLVCVVYKYAERLITCLLYFPGRFPALSLSLCVCTELF
jgi:hypothetical protein